MALLLKHVTERPKPIAALRPDAPAAMADAIERALLKSPEDRWETAGVFRDALSADARPQPSWRSERVEPVRYISPIPQGQRDRRPREVLRAGGTPGTGTPQPAGARDAHSPVPLMHGDFVLEPAHLVGLTPEQRADLKLWNGQVNLIDRIKTMRRYVWLTAGAACLGMTGFVAGVSEADFIPFVFSPIVPMVMSVKVLRRRRSLHASGLKLRRVIMMPRAGWVLPRRETPAKQLVKIAPREVLDGPTGNAIRSAAEDREAIRRIIRALPRADRKMLPDLEPAVNALVERIGHLAQMLHRLGDEAGSTAIDDLDATIARMEREGLSLEAERRLALLKRQRNSLSELHENRANLRQQLENATLMLGNLRLDVVKLRTSGLQAGWSDLSSATQEVRALSRDIGLMLEAADEVRSI
jgi:serine/threonine-protein kinase